jgi:hypothetical protein
MWRVRISRGRLLIDHLKILVGRKERERNPRTYEAA